VKCHANIIVPTTNKIYNGSGYLCIELVLNNNKAHDLQNMYDVFSVAHALLLCILNEVLPNGYY
jgi:hypothetical protein